MDASCPANCTGHVDPTTTHVTGVSAIVGAAVSVLSTLLLGFLWYTSIRAKDKLRALTWAVPPGSNVGKRAFFASRLRKRRASNDEDDQIVRVQGGFGPDMVTLHSESQADVARPVIILSCEDSAWQAIKAAKNVDGDLLVTLLVLALGNLVAAAVAVRLWARKQSLDLVTSLAGNTLLVVAPLVLLSLKLVYSKIREMFASTKVKGKDMDMIDMETVLLAIKESVEGSVRLLVPVFSMSYILRDYPIENGPEQLDESGTQAEGGNDSDHTDRPAFISRLKRNEAAKWFELGVEKELYRGFNGLYNDSVIEQAKSFRAAWLGKLLSKCNGESDRNKIIASIVLSHLRWSIVHAKDGHPSKNKLIRGEVAKTVGKWCGITDVESGRRPEDTAEKGLGNDGTENLPPEGSGAELAGDEANFKLEDALLLDNEGKATITFAKQGSNTKYYVPFVMLDTVSMSRDGETLNKHWAAYNGRKQMQENEELLKSLYERTKTTAPHGDHLSDDESLDVWALVNKLRDRRPDIIKNCINSLEGK